MAVLGTDDSSILRQEQWEAAGSAPGVVEKVLADLDELSKALREWPKGVYEKAPETYIQMALEQMAQMAEAVTWGRRCILEEVGSEDPKHRVMSLRSAAIYADIPYPTAQRWAKTPLETVIDKDGKVILGPRTMKVLDERTTVSRSRATQE